MAGIKRIRLQENQEAQLETMAHHGCLLLKLPNELLVQIAEHPLLDYNSVRNMALSSSRLFYIVQRHFYKGFRSETFGRAVGAGDVEAMERCARFKAAPVQQLSVGMTSFANHHVLMPPLMRLVAALERARISAQECRRAMDWLLEHGADPTQTAERLSSSDKRLQSLEIRSPIQILIIMLSSRALDRDAMDLISGMIHLLCSRQVAMPHHISAEFLTGPKPHKPFLGDSFQKIMELFLLPNCPPTVLERYLEEHDRHAVALPYACHLDIVLANMMGALADSTSAWKEAYPGEIVGMMEQKIKLLVRYRAIDGVEQECFENLVSALRNIYNSYTGQTLGGLDLERHGLHCWYKLSTALWPLRQTQQARQTSATQDRRTHSFLLPGKWDPRMKWVHEMQVLRTRRRSTRLLWTVSHPLMRGRGPFDDELWGEACELEWQLQTTKMLDCVQDEPVAGTYRVCSISNYEELTGYWAFP